MPEQQGLFGGAVSRLRNAQFIRQASKRVVGLIRGPGAHLLEVLDVCDGVLFTSGPDVVSEAVQGAREAVAFGARGADAAPLAGVAVLDPGPLIVNANSFTWRGHGNPALAKPPD